MSVKYKGWLSQSAVISLRKLNGGDGWHWRFGKNEICLSMFTNGSGTLSWVRLLLLKEHNTHDRYAVAILEEDTCCSVGYLPREVFPDHAGLGFLPGGFVEGIQRIGSGSSTRSKKLVILAAIALEHASQIFHTRKRVLGIFSKYASPFAIFLASIF